MSSQGKSVLDAGFEAGADLPFACKGGVCCTCKAKIVEGSASMDVNYAPNGFTAYEVPGENVPSLGRTGMPVAIQVTLQFQETTYLTKSYFRNDRSSGTQAKV